MPARLAVQAVKYHLETLLRMRQVAEDGAAAALAHAQSQTEAARREHARLAERAIEATQRARAERTRRTSAPAKPAQSMQSDMQADIQADMQAQDMHIHERFLARLDADAAHLAAAVARHEQGPLKAAAEAEAAARAALTLARRERETIEKHKETWADRKRVETDRRAEDAAADLAQATWRRHRG